MRIYSAMTLSLGFMLTSGCSYLTERQGPEGKQGEQGGQGVQGLTSLVNLTDELPGANCAVGGKRVDTGIDSNADGILDADEVTDTAYVCNGDQGVEGPQGIQGETGLQGPQGEDGYVGAAGPRGFTGLACWDTNQSGTCDTIPEDLNNDGICSALDCMGPPGQQGEQGLEGPPGPQCLTKTKWFAQQTADNTVVGENWVDLTGALVQFDLTESKNVELRASGGVSGAFGTGTYTHCGFRFMIDGVAYGDSIWGDRIVGCGKSSSGHPGWWCQWNIERDVTLDAGNHSIQVQMTGWISSDVYCRIIGNDPYAAKLFVEIL